MRGRFLTALMLALVVVVLCGSGAAFASTAISGGGSGFAGLEFDQWQNQVALPANGSLAVSYSAQSSGIGRQYFADGTWDFGVTDLPYIAGIEDQELSQLQSGRCGGRPLAQCFVYVPVSAAGLGFMYNLSNADGSRFMNLELTPVDVCRIFTGQLNPMTWGNAELVANNPSLAGFTQHIFPVVRQDEAGESYVLSQFCIADDPTDWNSFIAFQQQNSCATSSTYYAIDAPAFQSGEPISIWPYILPGCVQVQSASSGIGVADAVASPTLGLGTITYDAMSYAITEGFPNASVENPAGVFIQPGANSVQTGLSYVTPNSDGTFNVDFSAADPGAYFPATFSYVLAQTGGFDPGKGATLGEFLCYAVGPGQGIAARFLFAPLSSAVANEDASTIAEIPGAPTAASCQTGVPPLVPEFPLAVASVVLATIVMVGYTVYRRRRHPSVRAA